MSCKPVLSAHKLGKAYRLYRKPQDRLKHMLLGPLGREYGKAFWALRGVSFDLCPGEMLAVIGKNGSGKSTLLQILAGTLKPTEGTLEVQGRIAALLELGSGFHPEFTGRENIFINGAILGLSRREMEERVDDIIAFADIGEFIDQPVKYYSSGMFVRLAFAVTTGLSPDVLLVDEALAVGDIFFKQKCYRRLEQLLDAGTAVVLVTHNMGDVEMFAHKAILLSNGEVYYQGEPSEAVRLYFLLEQQEQEARIAEALKKKQGREKPQSEELTAGDGEWPQLFPVPEDKQVLSGKAVCTGVLITDAEGRPKQVFRNGDEMHVYYEFEVLEDITIPVGGISIRNARDVLVHGKTVLETDTRVPPFVEKGSKLRFHQRVSLEVGPGEYSLEVGLAEILPGMYEQRSFISPQELRNGLARLCHVPEAGQFVVVLRPQGTPAVMTHRGLCNLPGHLELQVAREAGEIGQEKEKKDD